MKRVKNIVLLVSAIWLSVLVGGCSGVIYDHYSAEDDPEDQDLVTLVLNVGLVSPTRAALPDHEMMHDLRIVLLDADGKVEYNELIGFDSGAQEYKEGVPGYRFIRTKPGDKKIFFVANEASVTAVHSTNNSFTGPQSLTAVLNRWPAGSTNFENMVKSIYFSSDYSGNIPLSSSYAFTITDADLGERVVKEFYLVHAATKFEFEFLNSRTSSVTVNSLSISSISDNMYLMANFGDTPAEEKMGPEPYDDLYWIDWLKEVSEATTAYPNNPDNKDINAQYGWITDYNIPSGTQQVFTLPVNRTINSNGEMNVPIFYCPESKNPGQNGQAYTLNIDLGYLNPQGRYQTRNEQISLENLKTLFRNTHVKITVEMGEYGSLIVAYTVCLWNKYNAEIVFE